MKIQVPRLEATETEKMRIGLLWRIGQEIHRTGRGGSGQVVAKGGTALAVGHGLPRPSTDLDLDSFAPKRPDQTGVVVERALASMSGLRWSTVTAKQGGRGYVRIEARAEDGTSLDTKIDVHARDDADPWDYRRRMEESFARGEWGEYGGMPCYELHVLAEQKIRTLIGDNARVEARDLYDTAWLLAEKGWLVRPETLADTLEWTQAVADLLEGSYEAKWVEDEIMRRADFVEVNVCLHEALAVEMERREVLARDHPAWDAFTACCREHGPSPVRVEARGEGVMLSHQDRSGTVRRCGATGSAGGTARGAAAAGVVREEEVGRFEHVVQSELQRAKAREVER